jgi:hypothetical protein
VFVRSTRYHSNAKSLELSGLKLADGGVSSERPPSSVVIDGPVSVTTAAAATSFTFETFTPELVRGRSVAPSQAVGLIDLNNRVETMNETFSKVIAFLQNSGQFF